VDVFVPWERVFLAGEWEHSGVFTYNHATHHRHTCIGARAGFGDRPRHIAAASRKRLRV